MSKPHFLIFAGQVLLAITLIALTFFVTNTLKQIKFGQGTIHVKGCAEKQIQSDFVKWQGVVSASSNTQSQAYEKLEKDIEVLRKYLQEQGVASNEIEFAPIATSIVYQRNDAGHALNKIDSYELSQS